MSTRPNGSGHSIGKSSAIASPRKASLSLSPISPTNSTRGSLSSGLIRVREGVPVRSLCVPSHVPSHPQTAAKVRGFSPTASGFAAETDWLLEGSGFEPSVPPGDRNRIASRCVPDGMWMPVPWRSCKEQHRLSMNLSHRAPGARPARRSRRVIRGLGNLRQRPAKPAPSVLDRHGGAPCRTASYVERYLASSANPGTTWSVAG